MGPPGGGRNDITGRMTRHLNVISIDSFSDDTMTKIFTSISDWHFANGFDASITRLGMNLYSHSDGGVTLIIVPNFQTVFLYK